MPYYDQNAPILMAQGTAMRNGTPMRLVSPAPVLVQPQASRQTPAGASLYSSTPQGLYGANVNTTVNGGTLSGECLLFFRFLYSFFLDVCFLVVGFVNNTVTFKQKSRMLCCFH